MQFGVSIPNFGRLGTRETVVSLAQQAEALGYDSIWTTDHVMMAKGQEEPYGQILEALTTLTYLAALTNRVRLGVSVIVLPQRNPIVVAKQMATLDHLSGGRLIVGLGAGWNEREFQFLGADFLNRGQRLNEYIQVFRELWTSSEPRFEGRYVQFSDALFAPRPAQPNGPPIWIGGGSSAALRRTAQLADGWHSNRATPASFVESMQRIRELANGRQVEGTLRIRVAIDAALPEVRGADGGLQPTISGRLDEVARRVSEYEAAGVSHMVVQFRTESLETYLEDLRRFAAEVRPAVRPTSG
jgi:probable F420-dependent oxidoreductase